MTSYLMNHFYRHTTDLFFSNDTLGICPNEDINTKVEHEALANAVIGEEQNHREAGGLRRAKHKCQNQEETHMSLNLSYEVSSLVNCSLYSVMIKVNHPQKKI